MNLTKKQAIEIAKTYKERYPLLHNKIKDNVQFSKEFDVEGKLAWIVEGEYELFGEKYEFWYVISDKTKQVEYTFNHHGTRDPHIDRPITKEWKDYIDDDL